MDHQNWFNGLTDDASEHEDQRTVLTRWAVHPKGDRLEWKKPVTLRTDEGAHAYAIGRRIDEKIYGSILVQVLRHRESLSSARAIRKFRGQTTHRTPGWISSRKIGGSEDITQESTAQYPSCSTFSQPDYLQSAAALSQSTYHFPIGLW